MNNLEVVKLFAIIGSLYPREESFKNASEQMVQVWQRMLNDIDFALAQNSVIAHASISKFPPTIADIREKCVEITNPEMFITGEEAWAYVIKAVRQWGYGQKKRALESMPKPVAEYTEKFGYKDICLTDSITNIRNQYIRGWESEKQYHKDAKQLPDVVRQQIAENKRLLLDG